jgi:geranylgeranylglycerol-phosphate geranylgeranyltransferase
MSMTLDRKIKGLVRLFRPELPFAAGVCVVLGEVLARGGFPSFMELLPGFVCGFCLSAAALILNDYFDLEVDKVNAPERPLPSGMVSKADVLALAAVTTLAGLGAAFVIGMSAFIFGILFWFVGFLYNWRFKQTGLPGNLMVSASVAFTFILGGIAVGDPRNKAVWLFSLIAFLIDLGEEIAGDAMDIEGDRQRDSKSIAIQMGKSVALRVSGLLFFLVVPVSYLPFVFGWLGLTYLVVISLANIVTILSTIKLLKSRMPDEGHRFMRRIYLGGLFGMLAFMIGRFFA